MDAMDTLKSVIYDKNTISEMLDLYGTQAINHQKQVSQTTENENLKTNSLKITEFKDRPNKGKTLEILNAHLDNVDNLYNTDNFETMKNRCDITVLSKHQMDNYKYMYQTPNEKFEVLVDRMNIFAEVICKHYAFELDAIADPAMSSQSEIFTLGRICCDSEGKMNSNSIILEPLPTLGGKGVKLVLNNLSSYALFPGQIPLLPMCRTRSGTVIDYNYGPTKLNGNPLKVIIAAGPYTLDNGLEFEPLLELLNKMKIEKPNVLILMGPFIHEDHPLIQEGEMKKTPGETFRNRISQPLKKFMDNLPEIKVIVIPNIKDICHHHLAFPQPPFDKSGLPPETICFPNPVQFQINEIIFSICNVDVLCNIYREEVSTTDKAERIFRTSHHLLTQRHLYPLFPPSPGEVNLDLKHSSSLDLLYTPDVLILPSKLKHFAKIIDNVICINPGYLAKGLNTYAKMVIHPFPQELANEADVEHFVHKRARVEIVRI
ncbi:10751_t:CDS:10 [Diversispora eburnea]|uniref:DNA polymerase alpha subunit B n=1 Tax=Diversispora eburnea TaxID=1213867 RepID=A0A9N9CDW9_9GLOM|nr:10751_t:CDS:10 [Diversispora eburnea]